MELKKNKRIGVFVGSRPNFVKSACLIGELDSRENVDVLFVNTGQHYDYKMAGIFFEEFGLRKPDINLMAAGRNHVETIANIIQKTMNHEQIKELDEAVVFGDVNSTLAVTLACTKLGIPIHHVESGLRSFDRRMPEEINRTIVDQMSEFLHTTEGGAEENLTNEGISKDKIFFSGNIMIDTLKRFLPQIEQSIILNTLGVDEKKYVLCTVHRQENVDVLHGLKKIVEIIKEVSKEYTVVYPMHPRTKSMMEKYDLMSHLDNVKIIEPLGYLDFLKLQSSAHSVITDSGGVQEETTYLNVPCITLRDSTERPITVTQGTNTLVKINDDRAIEQIKNLLSQPKYRSEDIPLWDGMTSKRIADHICNK